MFQERKFHPWAIYLSRLMQLGQRKFKAAIKSFNSSIKQSAGAALFADQAVSPKEAFAAYIIEPLPESEQKLIQQFVKQKTDNREGDYFVSVKDDEKGKYILALGPFKSHEKALSKVADVEKYLFDHDPRAPWYAYGTARQDKGSGSKGVLNDKMGFKPCGCTKRSSSTKLRLLKAKKAKKLKLIALW
jgi:hypothetical protein